jgi:hypothetical protein
MLAPTPFLNKVSEPHTADFSVKFTAPNGKELHQTIEQFIGQKSTQFSAIPLVGMISLLFIAVMVEFVTGNVIAGVLCTIALIMPVVYLMIHPMWDVRLHVSELMKMDKKALYKEREWCRRAIAIQSNIYHHAYFGWVYAVLTGLLTCALFVFNADYLAFIPVLLPGVYVMAVDCAVVQSARTVVQGTAFCLWCSKVEVL